MMTKTIKTQKGENKMRSTHKEKDGLISIMRDNIKCKEALIDQLVSDVVSANYQINRTNQFFKRVKESMEKHGIK